MEDTQQHIENVISQIGELDDTGSDNRKARRSTRATRGKCLTKTYKEEYQMALLNKHDNSHREVTPMTKLAVTEHII